MPAKIFIGCNVYDGDYVYDKGDAKISVYDHGFLYGDGVFEGMRVYGGKVFRLDAHLDRLWRSAEAIWMEIPMSKEEMGKAVNGTVEKTGIRDINYVRLIVSRGVGDLGLSPKGTSPQVIVIADKIKLYPKKVYTEGLEIVTAKTVRNHPAALDPKIKSLNYLNNILAKIEGQRADCEEALMLNLNRQVAECTGDNIFLISDGHLLTPPVDAGILVGITREVVIELAKKKGIPVQEKPLTLDDVYSADECFLTGSAAEVVPVVRVDDHEIGNGKPGEITCQLMTLYEEEVMSP